MRIVMTLLIAALTAAGGCKKAPAAQSQRNVTPKDALLALLHGMKEANTEKVLAACKSTPEQRPIIEAGSNYTKEVYKFRELFLAAYGAQKWDEFQDPAHRPGLHDTTFIIIDDDALEKATKTEFAVDGDKAACTMPSGQGKVQLIKNPDGTWIVDGSTFVPTMRRPEELKATLDALAAIVKKYEKAIGKPNITPGDIDYEMGREISGLVNNEIDDSRHRFDINKI
jgi:hypothetical protein